MAKLTQHTYSQAQFFVVKSFSLGFFKAKLEPYPIRVDKVCFSACKLLLLLKS